MRIFISVLMLCIGFSVNASAQLRTLQTENLRLIHYTKLHEYLVPHMARCFENSLQFHRRLFDYTPSRRITLLVQDFGDFGFGAATAVPRNFISIGISPFSHNYETLPVVERMSWVMSHETAHIVSQDQSPSSTRFYRSLFGGKVLPIAEEPLSLAYCYLTTPRTYAPSWYFEGFAVFMETWMNGGLGRALGSYDEMVFRTMVRDSAYFYDVVGLEAEGTKVDFQVGANSYLYGTRFYTYLANTFGPEKIIEWNKHGDGDRAYFASQFQHVFGSPLDDQWSRWIAWEQEWQKQNLDSIRTYPVTPLRVLSRRKIGSVSRSYYDHSAGTLYAALNYPGQVAHLASINTENGDVTKLEDVRGGALFYVTSLAYDQSTGTLFYTTDNKKWRDLYAFDLKTHTSRRLLKEGRVGDLAFNRTDRSLWGIRHFNGIATIVRIPHPYEEWNQMYSFPYGKDVFDIDVSPDGNFLTAALGDVDGTQLLIRMETAKLMQGDGSFDTLYNFEQSTPSNFVFSPDGRYVYGNTFYTGVSNLVRYDFHSKNMEWLTNCETGLFRPIPVSNDSLIAFEFTSNGFVPVMLGINPVDDINPIRYLGQQVVENHPIVRRWQLPPPSEQNVNLDSLVTEQSDYTPMSNLSLTSMYPIVQGYKVFPAYGMRLDFSDDILLSSLNIRASYSPNTLLPDNERFHAGFTYRYTQFRLAGAYNEADFYDLFGPTRKSRKGYSLAVDHENYLIFKEPETMHFSIRLAGYGGLERLPDYQNVQTSIDKFATLSADLDYRFVMESLGAVDDEMGVTWGLHSFNTYARSTIYPRIHATLDYGFLLPLDHSFVWIRTAAGKGFGGREEPFANFYFGGFGNNRVDHQTEKRYREYYSFPGTELNAIGGTTFAKGMIEWTLPPLRFRRFGIPAFYCNWARLAFFSTGIVTNVESQPDRRSILNVGSQLDFKIVIFSRLESTLSFGYAAAAEKDRHLSTEFMVSLKIHR